MLLMVGIKKYFEVKCATAKLVPLGMYVIIVDNILQFMIIIITSVERRATVIFRAV